MMYNYPGWDGTRDRSGDLLGVAGAIGCIALFTLVLLVLYLWLFYRIFKKAGYSGWYTLINLIPYVGSVIVLFILAFGQWPIERGMQQGYDRYGPGYPPGGPSGYTPPGAPQQPGPMTYPQPPAGEWPQRGPEPPAPGQ